MAPLQAQLFASTFGILLLVASASGNRHKQIASANAHCNLNCLNDGYCSFTKYFDYPQKGDHGYYKSCVCRPGFGGGSCEKVLDECQAPNYQCHNGAPCEYDENGKLGCDCSHADAQSDLAGYMCRNPTVRTCDTLDENNKSYCTNGGICLSSMTASPNHLMFSEPTTHEGCQCTDSFTGEHCEFIKDMPRSSLAESTTTTPNIESTGAKAGISMSLFVLAGILIVAFVVRRRKRQQLRNDDVGDQSWETGEDRFRDSYMDNIANQDNNDLGMEEQECVQAKGNMQSVMDNIDG